MTTKLFESDESTLGAFSNLHSKICPSAPGGQPISLSSCGARFQNQVHDKNKLPGELASLIIQFASPASQSHPFSLILFCDVFIFKLAEFFDEGSTFQKLWDHVIDA